MLWGGVRAFFSLKWAFWGDVACLGDVKEWRAKRLAKTWGVVRQVSSVEPNVHFFVWKCHRLHNCLLIPCGRKLERWNIGTVLGQAHWKKALYWDKHTGEKHCIGTSTLEKSTVLGQVVEQWKRHLLCNNCLSAAALLSKKQFSTKSRSHFER